MFRRLSSLVVALAILLPALNITDIAVRGAEEIVMTDSNKPSYSESMKDGGCVSTRFAVNGEISGIDYKRTKEGSRVELVFSLYEWMGNYVDTINSAPIGRKTFETNSYKLNEWMHFEGPFPAGEYLFEVRYVREGGTASLYEASSDNTAVSYVNHLSRSGTLNIKLDMASGGITEISKASEKERGIPAEYILPEDHPIYEMNVNPTSWAATDGLDRKLSMYGDTYTVNVDGKLQTRKVGVDDGTKKVGIFYHTWNYGAAESLPARNVTEILKDLSPEEREAAKHDYSHKVWKNAGDWHFWNEPLFGYYTILDEYVLRKHAELLAAAGVDFIIMDNTNGSFTWQPAYYKLCEVWEQARLEGVKTPQIVFMLPFGPSEGSISILYSVYKDIYRVEKFRDLWFYLDGKPLILAYTDNLNPDNDSEVLNFFTYRKPYTSQNYNDTLTAKQSEGYWGWLWKYPQTEFCRGNKVEEITVGVAQNINYKENLLTAMSARDVMGRSYSGGEGYYYTYNIGDRVITCNSDMENSMYYGINFQQQFDYALTRNPEIMFVTGWNEWMAIRANSIVINSNPVPENCMADQFDDEYSRDIEPSAGVLKDYYYYQLVENVRRFKGVNPVPDDGTVRNATIDISGNTNQWDNISSFNAYIRSTYDRDSKAFRKQYENHTMRNDIRKAKVAFDSDNFYFYVETVGDLSPETDSGWMRLFIDIDLDEGGSTEQSWEGFEYVINRVNPQNGKCTLERSEGGWNWQTVSADLSYSVSGKILQIAVPRSCLGLGTDVTDSPSFNFKWSDNMQEDGNILDFYSNGDVAPTGRFTYCFSADQVIIIPENNGTSQGINLVPVIIIAASVVAAAAVALIIVIKKSKK